MKSNTETDFTELTDFIDLRTRPTKIYWGKDTRQEINVYAGLLRHENPGFICSTSEIPRIQLFMDETILRQFSGNVHNYIQYGTKEYIKGVCVNPGCI